MLCSKCHKSVPRGEEIQIKDSIICQECSLATKKEDKEMIIARCWNCNRFIYKGELIHEIARNDSKNFSKWFSIGSGSSEKLSQCDECYQKWRSKVRKAQNLSRLRFLLLGFCIGYSLNLVLKLFFPEISKRVNDNMSSIIVLFVILFMVIIILEPILNVDRCKISVKKKKSKN